MNDAKAPGPDPGIMLKQALLDDLPRDVETRMLNQFRIIEGHLDQRCAPAVLSRPGWMPGSWRREILAFVSATLLLAGGVLPYGRNGSVFAHSVERLKTVVSVSSSLGRVSSMDCTVEVPGPGRRSYRVRWEARGSTRVEMVGSGNRLRTLWVSDTRVSMAGYAAAAARARASEGAPLDPSWVPVLEFLTPSRLAQYMEERYGLTQVVRREGSGRDRLLLIGKEGNQVVEMDIDTGTYLPKSLRKCSIGSSRASEPPPGRVEIRFQWNQPARPDLSEPGTLEGNGPAHR